MVTVAVVAVGVTGKVILVVDAGTRGGMGGRISRISVVQVKAVVVLVGYDVVFRRLSCLWKKLVRRVSVLVMSTGPAGDVATVLVVVVEVGEVVEVEAVVVGLLLPLPLPKTTIEKPLSTRRMITVWIWIRLSLPVLIREGFLPLLGLLVEAENDPDKKRSLRTRIVKMSYGSGLGGGRGDEASSAVYWDLISQLYLIVVLLFLYRAVYSE